MCLCCGWVLGISLGSELQLQCQLAHPCNKYLCRCVGQGGVSAVCLSTNVVGCHIPIPVSDCDTKSHSVSAGGTLHVKTTARAVTA